MTDTYFYLGKLYPEENCIYFNPGEIPLEKGWVLDIYASGMHLWNHRLNPKKYDVRAFVKEAYSILVSAFNFITDSKLRYVQTNLIEAKGIKSKNNLIWGFYDKTFLKRPGSRKNRFNRAWKRIGKSFPSLRRSFYHKVILRDYQNCIDSVGDDRFFYAYRIIENVRRVTTRHLPNFEDKEYWDDMHKILGTNRSQIEGLISAAKMVRHGDFKDLKLRRARRNADAILETAFRFMAIEFKRSFKNII